MFFEEDCTFYLYKNFSILLSKIGMQYLKYTSLRLQHNFQQVGLTGLRRPRQPVAQTPIIKDIESKNEIIEKIVL